MGGRTGFKKLCVLSCTLLVLAFYLGGCNKRRGLDTMATLPNDGQQICSVAVFPFTNETSYKGADLLAYRVFVAELVRTGLFDVMLEGEVRSFFRENRILLGSVVIRDFYVKMGKTMGVDGVILGTVLAMDEEVEGKDTVIPKASIRLELIRIKDGRPVVTSYHRRSGDDFRKIMHVGVVQTIPDLMSRMTKEVVWEWKEEGLMGCAN